MFKHLSILLLIMACVGCQKQETHGPRTIRGAIVYMKDGESVTLGDAKIWLFKGSDVDAKMADFGRKLEAQKVAIENQIMDMDANYRLWGITKQMPAGERAARIPADQASRVAQFEKSRPAFDEKLKAECQFDFKTLLTVPSVIIPVDANHEFSVTLPGSSAKEEFAIFAVVKAEGKWSPDQYYLMRWISDEALRQGRITLTDRDSFWVQGVVGWLIYGRRVSP